VFAFLTTVWKQGALRGVTPQEAFVVICDASNNMPGEAEPLDDQPEGQPMLLVQDEGIVNLTIGYAPLYPADFITVDFQIEVAGTQDE
jgi:phage tail sheath protein FI